MGKYYITTTLPYVNADPHVGFALEIVRADVLARYHQLQGDEIFFNTGTDEHGQKIYEKALAENKDPQKYTDEYAAKFSELKKTLNLAYTNFIRTTDEHHVKAAQEFWRRVEKNGFIYKAKYETKYCVGCELEKQDSDLVDGHCPLHPKSTLERREEENYFFKFSAFEKQLLDLYEKNPEFVVPENRLLEIKNFVQSGLKDFSISRLKEKMPWGIEVPGDSNHIMYVWFDALVNYISCLGWPEDEKKFTLFWPGMQICGKDNLRQQSAMWQAMLMAAKLPTSKQILVNGFITAGNGIKMSKSLGNVINPYDYVEKYGTDALRYFLLAKISPFDDSDFTKEKFEEAYQSDLANGLGNLVARVAAMAQGYEFDKFKSVKTDSFVADGLDAYRYDQVLDTIWSQIKIMDSLINEKEIWKLEKNEKFEELKDLISRIRDIAVNLEPFMPATAEEILNRFGGEKIVKGEALFQRLS